MKFKLIIVLCFGFLLASCSMENIQSGIMEIPQTVGGYVQQTTDYIGNLY
jgi:hypothetical protein